MCKTTTHRTTGLDYWTGLPDWTTGLTFLPLKISPVVQFSPVLQKPLETFMLKHLSSHVETCLYVDFVTDLKFKKMFVGFLGILFLTMVLCLANFVNNFKVQSM